LSAPGQVYLLQPGQPVIDYEHRGVPGAKGPDAARPQVPVVE